jgi:NADP-dependent 3-hydroxy acid dehydrogenase YdfG
MSGILAGKVALVTGASSGIGEGIALALAGAGASVALAARRADRLEALARRIKAHGGTALALPGDMTLEAEAARAVAETSARLGGLDVLVNSAGVMQGGGIENADLAEYRRVFDINLFATLYCCQAAIPHMLEQGAGDIINITSLAARKGGAGVNAYAASKHAANAMTDGMRQELGGRNIRVSILMPGATRSEVAENISNPAFREAIRAHVTKDEAVLPEEIGATVVFMLGLPRRVNLSEICVRPTIDTSA